MFFLTRFSALFQMTLIFFTWHLVKLIRSCEATGGGFYVSTGLKAPGDTLAPSGRPTDPMRDLHIWPFFLLGCNIHSFACNKQQFRS